MKICCVTTTVNTPTVLALYAKHGPAVHYVVIGDRKTDDMAVVDFLHEHVPNHAYYGIDYQHKLYPKLSHLIGENCIQRRNIGFLEALKWGADIIISIDDDNIPLGENYFTDFHVGAFGRTYSLMNNSWREEVDLFEGLKASSPSGWFDVGQLLQPKAEHRGFPYTKRAQPAFESVTDAKIGVAAGICMGDPDIGAVERIANGPTVHGVSELLRSGIVTDPRKTWTVWNSQNTAVIRELVPAWFMIPHIGRADDIFASLITQRVMRESELHVHFGRPFIWQQRNQHDLTKDLVNEIICVQQALPLAGWLDSCSFKKSSVFEKTRKIWQAMDNRIIPASSIEAACAWCDALEGVL